jgi:8-oxo-dGTP pyrophosphatase MutT (NUDIX family)
LVFICYSHKDQRWLDQLETMLTPLRRTAGIDVWSDQRIQPGDPWRQEIDVALARTKVVVLLVSPNFLASRFISDVELPAHLEAVRADGVRILWVPVSDCLYRVTPIGTYQAVLDPDRPLDTLTTARRRRALVKVCESIQQFVSAPDLPEPADEPPRGERPVETDGLPSDRSDRGSGKISEEIQVIDRRNSEDGGDEFLLSAAEARFVALTYKTLSATLASDERTRELPNLRNVELAVYALPILREWHPTLRQEGEALSREWRRGLTNVLTSLLQPNRCPRLERLDVRVINRVPTFTASVLTRTPAGAPPTVRIKYTPLLEEEEPSDNPTLQLTVRNPFPGVQSILAPFARIIDNMRARRYPLTFPVLRRGTIRYVRPNVEEFVTQLSTISNHPKYRHPDALLRVRVRVGEALAGEVTRDTRGPSGMLELRPDEVYRCFDALRASHTTDRFHVSIDFTAKEALIELGVQPGGSFLEGEVRGRHIFAAFALITRNTDSRPTVVLKRKMKAPWPYDVPGGKVSGTDRSLADTVARELLEELGILVDRNGLYGPIAYKYDPHSRKEGVPVVACYFHLPLRAEDDRYLNDFPPPDLTDNERYPFTSYPLDELIAAKQGHRERRRLDVDDAEAECHAPLEVFERIARELT